ncbi:MAG TPA: hypothetical protein VM939_09305, partial [Gemmatimonadaceae bacterium]|nr:hypothetical protein [Gemmatimonadaceae bacterium]
LPALRKHAMALSAFYAEDYSRSTALFEEAIGLDSTFADAHIGLGTSLALAGIKPARQIEAAIRAYELRDKVDEAERYGVVGTYLSRVKGDRQGAIDAYRNQLNLDPTLGFYGALGSLLIQTRRYKDAERVLLKGIDVAPTSILYLHLANARLSQGRNADARATIDAGIARLPNHALLDGLSIDFEVALGNHGVADSLAHAAPAASAREASLRQQARVDGVRGKFGEAIAHLRDLRARQNAEGPTPGGLATLLTIARMQLFGLSDTAAALSEIDSKRIRLEMAAIDPRERPYVSVAHLLAAAGRPEPARAFLREYDANVPPDFRAGDRWLLLRTTALLKLADGKTETAISDLRLASDQEAVPLGSLAELAAAYKRTGSADSSSAVYKRYLDWKGMRRIDGDTFYLQKVLRESAARR